jgi:N-acetylglutamate synthase-like GNAT family acetyltransferase
MNSNENSASIRIMRADDADDIKDIYECITQKKTTDEDFRRLVQMEISRGEDCACFVLELNGKIAGFMITHILAFGFGMERSAWLATVGIHPKFMGRGFGAQLAREALQFCRSKGIHHLYTSVQWDSTDMLSFFKKLGFGRSDFINLSKTL